MECELCGRNTNLVKAEIEGTMLSVCNSCSQLGRRLEVTTELKEKKHLKLDESTINPDFAKKIKESRSRHGLSVEQLASKINEKASVVDRVEKGMRPTDALARKLEKRLRIKLLGFDGE